MSSAGPEVPSPAEHEGTGLETLAFFLGRWRLMLGVSLSAAIAAFLASLVIPPSYVAATTFVASRSGQSIPAMLAGLAGQFGVTVQAGEPNQSPDFYESLAQSPSVLDSALLSSYPDSRAGDRDSIRLLDVLYPRQGSLAKRLDRARRRLKKRLFIGIERATGIVSLRIEMRSPELAAAVANRLFEELTAFNVRTRQTTARARRAFLEARVATAQQELRDAEEALRVFLQRNRQYRDSPDLMFEDGRLNRAVQERQEVYISLLREYESARIEEVNNTPLLTRLEMAEPPVRQSWPRPLLLAAAAGLLGWGVTIGGVAFGRYKSRVRVEDPDGYVAMAAVVGDLVALLRRSRYR